MALKFYTSEAKGVTLKFRKSLGLISTFVGISPPPQKKKKTGRGWRDGGLFFFFLNWDSLHATLNNHYEAWSYKKKKRKNDYRIQEICLEITYS